MPASGEFDQINAPTAPRLLNPQQPPPSNPFENPFDDKAEEGQIVTEAVEETTIAPEETREFDQSVLESTPRVSQLPDEYYRSDNDNVAPILRQDSDTCEDQYRTYREPDRDCKITHCKLKNNPIYNISLHIDPTREAGYDPERDSFPYECTLSDELFMGRRWIPSTFTWKASALCHKPLYFEQRKLERYGHSAGPILQPVLSGAHFFANIAVLPYQMGMYPPNECRYALGYYRPGSCAPWMIDPIPLSLRGALLQTGAVLGVLYTTP